MATQEREKRSCASKKTGEMDQYIGGRLRLWRRTMEVDASALAERIGVTYQQLQKYEKGMNRISATRLYAIARELNVPIDYFYQDAEPPGGPGETLPDTSGDQRTLLTNGKGTDFLRCFASIKDPTVRKALIDLMRTINAEGTEAPEA